jgi:hypothetical protein
MAVHPRFVRQTTSRNIIARIHLKGMTMKQFIIGAVGLGVLAGVAMGLAPAAAASTADSVVNNLEAEGYTVRINQTPTAPLTACTVTGVDKLASATSAGGTAYVDVACPQGC